MINLAAFTTWCESVTERELIMMLYHNTSNDIVKIVRAEISKRQALKS